MQKIFAIALAFAIASACAFDGDIWVGSGQSNMTIKTGAGTVSNVYQEFSGTWKTATANIAIGFGKVVTQATGAKVGFMRRYGPGAPIQEWLPGGSKRGNLQNGIETAGAQLKGVMWYQGETDTSPDKDKPGDPYHRAYAYESNLKSLIADMRTWAKNDKLPVIIIQTGQSDKGAILVRGAQFKTAYDDPYCEVVSTYEFNSGLHRTAEELYIVGERVGKAAVRVAYGKESYWGPLFKQASFNTSDRARIIVEFANVKNAVKNYFPSNDNNKNGFFVIDPQKWQSAGKPLTFDYESNPGMLLSIKNMAAINKTTVEIELASPAPSQAAVCYGRSKNMGGSSFDFLSDDCGIPAPAFFNMPVGAEGTVAANYAIRKYAAPVERAATFAVYRLDGRRVGVADNLSHGIMLPHAVARGIYISCDLACQQKISILDIR